MTRKSNPMDIYFHMANHYRKLQSVRPVVDTSAPTGYFESKSQMATNRQSRPTSRTTDKARSATPSSVTSSRNSARQYRVLKYNGITFTIFKHDCISSDQGSMPSARSQSLPPRPPTRRKPENTPPVYLTRAYSGSPSRKGGKDSSQKTKGIKPNASRSTAPNATEVCNVGSSEGVVDKEGLKENQLSSKPKPAPRKKKPKKHTPFKNSISDHEYLQFSLRITEDIIRNDLYTNQEMRRVFNSHLEANRGRLSEDKMLQQIERLCKELNIQPEDEDGNLDNSKSNVKAAYKNVKRSLTCICPDECRQTELKNCECASTRKLPVQCSEHDKETDETIYVDITNPPTHENYDGNTMQNFLEHPHRGESFTNVVDRDEISNVVANVRRSDAFIQLPSLSIVSERTEPSTSVDSINLKLHPGVNVDSVSEFETLDVLPGFENLELSATDSNKNSSHAFVEHKDCTCETSSTALNPVKTTQSLGNEVLWLTCSCGGSRRVFENQSGFETSSNAEKQNSEPSESVACSTSNENSLMHSKSSQLEKLVSKYPSSGDITVSGSQKCEHSVSQAVFEGTESPFAAKITSTVSTGCSTSDGQCLTHAPAPEKYESSTIKSEPLKCSNHSCFDLTVRSISDDGQSVYSSNAIKSKEFPETGVPSSCVQLQKPSNFEEEYVLVTGPVYVPKSCMDKAATASKQHIVLQDGFVVKRNSILFTKDATVNTEQEPTLNVQENNAPNYTNVSSAASDISTYSKIHERALDVAHYNSYASMVSTKPNVPKTVPITESIFLRKNFNESPKCTRCQARHSTEQERKSCLKVQTSFLEATDYDLTPQRDDNNKTWDTFHNNELNKYNLLLGDEYELKGKTSSCYDNGLPYSIRKFFPDTSTQTCSSDWLLTSSPFDKSNGTTKSEETNSKSRSILKTRDGSPAAGLEPYSIFKQRRSTEVTPQEIIESLKKYALLENPDEPKDQKGTELEEQFDPSMVTLARFDDARESSMLDKQSSIRSSRQQSIKDDSASTVGVSFKEEEEEIMSVRSTDTQDNVIKMELGEEMSENQLNELSTSLQASFNENRPKEGYDTSQSEETTGSGIQEQLMMNMHVRESLDRASHEAEKRYSLKVNMEEWKSLEDTFSLNAGSTSNLYPSLKKQSDDEISSTEKKLSTKPEEEDEPDILAKLDILPPRLSKQSSLILTIKQVTSDLNRFRQADTAAASHGAKEYKTLLPSSPSPVSGSSFSPVSTSSPEQVSRRSSLAEHFASKTPRKSITQALDLKRSMQISKSDISLDEASKKSSAESVDTVCCGLRKVPKKARAEEHTEQFEKGAVPNISSVPEDNLYYRNSRAGSSNNNHLAGTPNSNNPAGTSNNNNPAGTSSSNKVKFNKEPPSADYLLRTGSASEDKLETAKVAEKTAKARNPVVTYRTPSMLPDDDKIVENIENDYLSDKATDEPRPAVVEILRPSNKLKSTESFQMAVNNVDFGNESNRGNNK